METILVTGGAGFIGSNFIPYFLEKNQDIRIVNFDKLTYAGDFRENSNTYKKHYSIKLSSKNNKQLFVPKGFLHGFVALEDNTVVNYKVDEYYNKESEFGIAFNTPELNIDWEIKEKAIIISEKDRELGMLNLF